MVSRRQITANRRNARKSTGPRTPAGKLRSRRNALRHGLTGETVIDVFENAEDYRAFEQATLLEYRPRTLIEHQLVVRLSSLLWRLRRATAIEAGLFSIQGRIMRDRRTQRDCQDRAAAGSKRRLYEMLGFGANLTKPGTDTVKASDHERVSDGSRNATQFVNHADRSDSASNALRPLDTNYPPVYPDMLAQCFLRVARLDDQILERVSRYEVGLWRQVMQILTLLIAKRDRSSQANCVELSKRPF